MRIVVDRHHGVLWEAFAILFSDRQVLGPADLVAWVDGDYVPHDGPIVCDFPPRTGLAVTTEWLAENGADLVISTVGATRKRMLTLAQDLGAVYVDHTGNEWDEPITDRVLRSTAGTKGVPYHPEFHRVPYRPATGSRIASFHASFEHSDCRRFWDAQVRDHPEIEFVMYGTEGHPLAPYDVAKAMRDCLAIWHCKDADGYGFAVHEAFASGRAVIGHRRHYQAKFAEPLFASGHLEPEDFRLDGLAALGEAALASFEATVDFDAEALAIRDYLGQYVAVPA